MRRTGSAEAKKIPRRMALRRKRWYKGMLFRYGQEGQRMTWKD